MSHYSLEARTARDVITLVLMLIFTFGRVSHCRKQWRMRRAVASRIPELVATLFLVLTTAAVLPVLAFTFDDIHKVRTMTEEEITAYNLTPTPNLYTYVLYLMQSISVWALKGTYLAMFVGFVPHLKGGGRRLLYGTLVVSIGGFIATMFIYGFWCRPVNINWNVVIGPDGSLQSCMIMIDVKALGILTLLNVAVDLLIALLSVFVVRSVKLREGVERFAMTIIFGIGFLSIAAAAVRWGVTYYVWGDTSSLGARVTQSNLSLLEHCMRIEVLFGTAAYGLPIARKLLLRLVARLRLLSYSVGWSSQRSLPRVDNSYAQDASESTASFRKTRDQHELQETRVGSSHS